MLRAAAGMIARRGLTLIGISLTNLCDAAAIQLALPFDRAAGLDRTLDELRDRFGTSAISRGAESSGSSSNASRRPAGPSIKSDSIFRGISWNGNW